MDTRAKEFLEHSGELRAICPLLSKTPPTSLIYSYQNHLQPLYSHFVYIMCHQYKYTGDCGHQIGDTRWEPETANKCPNAQSRHKGRPGERFERCKGARTSSYKIKGICDKDRCYVHYNLVQKGWRCHVCGRANKPNAVSCYATQTVRSRPGYLGPSVVEKGCGHNPCRQCS